MNDLVRPEDFPEGVPITAVLHLKNAHLLEAAKKLGSQKRLAEELGVTQSTIGLWINLRACPPSEPTPSWTKRRILLLERKLVRLVGKTLDEVFPQELRDNVEFLKSPKRFERSVHLRATALEQHAARTRERLESHGSPLVVDEREDNRKTVAELARDAGMNEREARVIAMRYPAEGNSLTLEEVGRALGVNRERVRQIEEKAVRKLRRAAGTHQSPPRRETFRVIDSDSQPLADHAGRDAIVRRARWVEQVARQQEGDERKGGLLEAARLYREAGLTHLAEEIRLEAEPTTVQCERQQ